MRTLLIAFKLLASTVYLVAAVIRPVPLAFIVAFALSFLGDVLLIGQSKRWLSLGIFAFFAAHVAFIVAFFVRGVNVNVAAIALSFAAPISTLLARWVLRHASQDMQAKVVAYVIVITIMVSTAAGTTLWLLFAALLFYASDILVARQRFVQAQPINRIVGLPLYYAAQALFVAFV